MAGSLAALKNLPCPAGNKCNAFQCLFKHDKDTDTRAAGAGNSSQSLNYVTATSSSDQVPPRKRIKLDSTTSATSQQQPANQEGLGKPASGQTQIKRDFETMYLQHEPSSSKTLESLSTVKKQPPPVRGVVQDNVNQGGSTQSEATHGESYEGNGAQDQVNRDEKDYGQRQHGKNTRVGEDQGMQARRVYTYTELDYGEPTEADNKPCDNSQDRQTQRRVSSNGRGYTTPSTSPSLAQARSTSTSSSNGQGPAKLASTPITARAQNLTKVATKAAPKKPEALNPRLLKSSPAKHDTRMKLVKALHEQYVRLNSELKKEAKNDISKLLVMSDQELIVRALDDEQEIATKRFQIYANAIRNKIMSLKKKPVSEWKEERMLATGAGAQNAANAQPAPPPLVTGLTTPQEVDFLHRLVWPFNGLDTYGYVHSIPSPDEIEQARASVQASGNIEVCDRCTRRFQVFPGRREEDGALTTNGSCTFHSGKVYFTERGPDKLSRAQKKYRCCHQNVDDDSGGCTTALTHVFKTTDKNRLASLLNFAETPPNPNVPADRAICFDCEMGFTVYGLELIRMTVVSWPSYEVLADVLVQPFGEVLDLNTRYSGVTPEDMVSAERWVPGGDHRPTVVSSTDPTKPENQQKPKLKLVASPKEARDLLFSLLAPETPLIGHGLENDLNSMRVIHPTCIDTVLLFPHKRGLPHRNSLRMLMETLLDQKIQVETDEAMPEGHDSAEDAKAAGQLARLKIREEWKTLQMKGWTIQEGKVAPPDETWTVVGGTKTKKTNV